MFGGNYQVEFYIECPRILKEVDVVAELIKDMTKNFSDWEVRDYYNIENRKKHIVIASDPCDCYFQYYHNREDIRYIIIYTMTRKEKKRLDEFCDIFRQNKVIAALNKPAEKTKKKRKRVVKKSLTSQK